MPKISSQVLAIALFVVLPVSFPAMAQEATPADSDEAETTIVVTAAGRTFNARGGEFRAAQRAFRQYRQRYAPQAELILQLSSPDVPAEQLRDLDLWLTSDDQRIRLPIDERMRFTLPELNDDDWEITTRRRGLRLQVSPWVLSPGSEIGDWRFGDLLLQCRVALAVMKRSMNLLERGMFDIAGGCGTRRTAIWQGVPAAITTAYIDDTGRRIPMEHHTRAFRLPAYMEDDIGLEARARLD